jgi:hypothetical protein
MSYPATIVQLLKGPLDVSCAERRPTRRVGIEVGRGHEYGQEGESEPGEAVGDRQPPDQHCTEHGDHNDDPECRSPHGVQPTDRGAIRVGHLLAVQFLVVGSGHSTSPWSQTVAIIRTSDHLAASIRLVVTVEGHNVLCRPPERKISGNSKQRGKPSQSGRSVGFGCSASQFSR